MSRNIKSFVILIVVSAIFYFVADYMIKTIPKKEDLLKTTGVITDINVERDKFDDDKEKHEVFVKYQIDGQEYKTKLNSYSSSYHVGKEIDLYYTEEDLYKVYTGNESLITNILRIAGLIGMIGGAIGVAYSIINKKNVMQS